MNRQNIFLPTLSTKFVVNVQQKWKKDNKQCLLNSGQLIFKYVFSKLFESKRLLKYDTYMES